MKKLNPAKFIFAFLGLSTFASLVGTVSGTLAWYAYSTRATLSYSGTSVSNTVQLQIGIASENLVTFAQEDEMVLDETLESENGPHYYFAPVGSGLSSVVINTYLEANGYATNSLSPVTSGSYVHGQEGEFVLKSSPNESSIDNSKPAQHSRFAYIPFVFRVFRSNTMIVTADDYISDVEIWLSDVKVTASQSDEDQGQVSKAVRMFVNRYSVGTHVYDYDFILNPTAEESGATKVGGLLDLTADSYYDYDMDGNEVIFGEYDESKVSTETPLAEDSGLVDINGSHATDFDTFTAQHHKDINYYSSFAEDAIKTAEYYCFDDVKPNRNPQSGALENLNPNDPSSFCFTGGVEEHYLGRVDMTIYLEGWDFNVVDKEMDHLFDLGLTFEINKL